MTHIQSPAQSTTQNDVQNAERSHPSEPSAQDRGGDVAQARIDARALWWREAEHCPHNQDGDGCLCWTEASWDFGPRSLFGAVVDAAGHRYITDARLLIREDQLVGWPTSESDPDYPYPTDLNQHPAAVRRVADMLAAPETGEPVTRDFDPVLLDPITASGYEVRPLDYERCVHAVVNPHGDRVGLVMPLLRPRRRRQRKAR